MDNEEKIEKNDKNEKLTFSSILNGSFLTGSFFTKQSKFVLFLSFLSILYISNRNKSESILNDIVKCQQELREIKSTSISFASELMYISKQSQVYNLVTEKELGLIEAKEPHKKIKIEE